jgi:oxygen-independent coproporphyrinogen-3 oxidase
VALPDPGAPFGIYVHFPFCAARCHYCAFYFVVGREEVRDAYLGAVVSEVVRAGADPRFAGRPVDSVYFGGGTPSLMAAGDVGEVLDTVRACFDLRPDAEISVEANPDGLGPERLAGFRAAGVNRITLGWQSLRKDGLKALTRTHGPDDNVRALERARAAGFPSVGVDLIFGGPGQTAEAWLAELDEAAELGPDHLSAYELTLEEGTRLARRAEEGRFELADEDARARMFDGADEVLARHGLVRYEISNFARPGHECRHNLAGWRSGDLLGVGASAASHVTNARWTNLRDVDGYVGAVGGGGDPTAEIEVLDGITWAAEDLYLGLRTSEGIDAGTRLGRVSTGAAEELRRRLEAARHDGLVEGDPVVRLTRRGRLFADTVFDSLLG